MPASLQHRFEDVLAGMAYHELVNRDLGYFLECSSEFQKLPAWKWLHGEQNFIRAKNRYSSEWLSDGNSGNSLCNYFASSVIEDCANALQARESLLSEGNASTTNPEDNCWLLNCSPFEVFKVIHFDNLHFALRYWKWVAEMATAISNYHYGVESEKLNFRKDTVKALVMAWQAFSTSIEAAKSAPELLEYLETVNGLCNDKRLTELAKLHQSGALYFVGRNDETVLERLFIREVTLFHRKLFFDEPPTAGMIADLLHMEGMKLSISERNIQRLIKATVNHAEEKSAIIQDVSEHWRQKFGKNRSTTVG